MLATRCVLAWRHSSALSFRLFASSIDVDHTLTEDTESELLGTVQNCQNTFGQTLGVCIEGYQGDLKHLSVGKARKFLSKALTHSLETPGIQGIQGLNTKIQQQFKRGLHTSFYSYHIQQSESIVGGDSENSAQGVQGDACVNFKLWMESCRRYGLDNCDQQLQGIQTGRKTLAQVLAEQDELIRSISQKYREEAAAIHQGESSVQGHQGDWPSFPAVNTPCPQGVQGEDCVRFKLWLENCHRFGFNECMDQLESMSRGRKSLGQVFAEQDQLIRSVVENYQQKRGYSTSAHDPKTDPQWG